MHTINNIILEINAMKYIVNFKALIYGVTAYMVCLNSVWNTPEIVLKKFMISLRIWPCQLWLKSSEYFNTDFCLIPNQWDPYNRIIP